MSEDQDTTSSFAVVITPEFSDNGEWLGSVTAHIEEEVIDDLDVDQLTQVRSVVGMMAATLSLMEEDPEIMERVKEHFITNYQDVITDFLEDIEDTTPDFTKKGNVIELNFNTKTHGNA